MLGINKRSDPPRFLRIRQHMQRQRRLAARFRTEHLNDASTRQPDSPQGQIERQCAAGNAGNRMRIRGIRQPHDRALAERLLNLPDCVFEHLRFGVFRSLASLAGFGCLRTHSVELLFLASRRVVLRTA